MAACVDSFPTHALNKHLDLPVRLESYDPEVYQRLPCISAAGAQLKSFDRETLISTTVRELFLAHKMDRTFGLVLLHRHFDLDASERLVDYGGTSVPWSLNSTTTTENIRPHNWLLTADGGIRPYEFYYTTARDAATEPDLANPDQVAFFDALKQLLRKYNVEGLLGLCRYPGDDFRG